MVYFYQIYGFELLLYLKKLITKTRIIYLVHCYEMVGGGTVLIHSADDFSYSAASARAAS
ncbi:hypothetical protein Mzhil_1358 [Methanosalsum zhilinae DSM 4017]|uniref:Uncharacterized protein n=1 Tax=Methanosalsum zhilinae (strain DSM 4017 / NBRC 107636 / OCM 62 / WeN5) TaxID=679901 RepID=F7XNF2_METZD|nr:hypothetical protein Mzhil_1358 [Methanosalsum zhilinae DSM 4017]